jgi:hypothetical protein
VDRKVSNALRWRFEQGQSAPLRSESREVAHKRTISAQPGFPPPITRNAREMRLGRGAEQGRIRAAAEWLPPGLSLLLLMN